MQATENLFTLATHPTLQPNRLLYPFTKLSLMPLTALSTSIRYGLIFKSD